MPKYRIITTVDNEYQVQRKKWLGWVDHNLVERGNNIYRLKFSDIKMAIDWVELLKRKDIKFKPKVVWPTTN